jgi:FKBP-type peptidyl-prolyl cis-trans isomerase 2
MKKIEMNSTVSVNYTGKLEDGSIFDSSLGEGREPLKATLGQGSLIKGFEDGLIGMSVGDKKTIEIEAVDAYGMVRPDFIAEIPLSQVPEGTKIGDNLQGMGPQGPVNVRVVNVTETMAVIDANHPLAGKKLIFDLEVVSLD